jgi:uncharacterized PurR-regulated membrane protein YhhQ (DUF165 family)
MSRGFRTAARLHPIEASELQARRERVFVFLAGLFLATLAILNILGISRFVVFFSLSPDEQGWNLQWGRWGEISFAVAVGVLPYPITFLCTDLISEFYGRRRANWVVTVGLFVNIWVMLILWLAGVMPQIPQMDPATGLPRVDSLRAEAGTGLVDEDAFAFYRIRMLAFGAVFASMLAYLAAQFCDVFLFHFWKRVTRGKHLWLRNNASTMLSQLVDTVAVILITHFVARALPLPPEGRELWAHLLLFIATGYAFKFIAALLDTIPMYLVVHWLRDYLQYDPVTETDLAKGAQG